MLETLINFVTVFLALSVATERLVELVKGMIPVLNGPSLIPKYEVWRQFVIHLMSLVAAAVVVSLSQDYIVSTLKPQITSPMSREQIAAFAILASGGSSFWNSILTYLLSLKNIKRQTEVAGQQAINDPVAMTETNLRAKLPGKMLKLA